MSEPGELPAWAKALANEIAVDALLDLIAELTDPDECRYDHDDQCQTHFLDARPCPHERARKVLRARTAAEEDGQ